MWWFFNQENHIINLNLLIHVNLVTVDQQDISNYIWILLDFWDRMWIFTNKTIRSLLPIEIFISLQSSHKQLVNNLNSLQISAEGENYKF